MRNLKANKGEWSELYVLASLLAKGDSYIANKDSVGNSSKKLKILEVIDWSDELCVIRYEIASENINVYKNDNLTKQIAQNQIASKVELFFNELVNSNSGSSFSLKSGETLLTLLEKNRISAGSQMNFDLHLRFLDGSNNPIAIEKGFSIKSEVGNRATLFNASHSTNFIYKVEGTTALKPFEDVSRVKSNIRMLTLAGLKLQFIKLESDVLDYNLRSIDEDLPEILGELLLNYYLGNSTKLPEIGSLAFPSNKSESEKKIVAIKKFLGAASMGLRAGSKWLGYPENFGGLLLVQRDGSILMYRSEDMSWFEDYLYGNLRLETPSASRHGFGQLEFSENVQILRLNLQIRY